MMKKILNLYLNSLYFLKLAKLNDAQFLKIYENSRLKYKLEQANLLDDFYKAMPKDTEKFIMEKYDFYKNTQNITQENITDPVISNFLKFLGDKYFDIKIEQFLPFYTRIRKESSDDILIIMTQYAKRKIKEVVIDYLNTPNATANILHELINYYIKYLSEKDIKTKSFFKIKTCDKLYNISAYIDVSEEINNINYERIQKALELRNSDIFDFVLQNEPIPTEKQKLEQEKITTKPDVRIDYADQPTVK